MSVKNSGELGEGKCNQIGRKLRIWSYYLKNSLAGSFIFYVVSEIQTAQKWYWDFDIGNFKTQTHEFAETPFPQKTH